MNIGRSLSMIIKYWKNKFHTSENKIVFLFSNYPEKFLKLFMKNNNYVHIFMNNKNKFTNSSKKLGVKSNLKFVYLDKEYTLSEQGINKYIVDLNIKKIDNLLIDIDEHFLNSLNTLIQTEFIYFVKHIVIKKLNQNIDMKLILSNLKKSHKKIYYPNLSKSYWKLI